MPEKKRGRPPFKPTYAQRATVEQMRYCGEAEAVIARAIRIDVDTLKKHFPDELADGHAKRRKEVVGMLFASAKKGNVTAQRKLEEMGRGVHLMRQPDAPERSEPAAGKKAAARADADAAIESGGKFAPRAPRLVAVGGSAVEAE